MKRLFIYALFVSILFAQCTPKTGETLTKAPENSNVEAPKPGTEGPKADTFRATAPPAGPAPRIQMGSAEQFALENGLQVILVENHKLPRVSYQLFVDVPPLTENNSAGTIQIAGDLLSKGTATKSKSDIDESIDFIGASLSTNANGMFGAALKKYNESLLAIMSDVLLHPSFPESEFDKAKKQYASQLAQDKDNPASLSRNLSSKVVYGADHPYGELMTEASLENITLDGVKAYYQNWFKPNITYLVVVGDITRAEAEPLLKQYFASWEADNNMTATSPEMPTAPRQNEVSFINKSGAVQSVISVAYPIDLKPGSPDEIPASVMNTYLGGRVYFGNRLMQNLREEHAYTYGASSSLNSDKYVGLFTAGASVRNEVTDSAIVEILTEMKKVRTTKVDEAEVQKVKNVLNGAFARSLENPETIALFALNTARYNLPKDYYASYLEKLAAVTAEDVMAMANKYIKPENTNIIVVGNQGDVADKLRVFSKNGKLHLYNNAFEEIEGVQQSIPEDLTAANVIEDYIKAIGGTAAIDKVNKVAVKMKGNIMGQNLAMEIYQQTPDKYAMMTTLQGAVINAEVLNGDKGLVSSMTGVTPADGTDMIGLREKAIPFLERKYISDPSYKIELAGMEEIEGKPAYKVKIVGPTEAENIDYYDTTSKLKVRSIVIQKIESEKVVQTFDISDYRTVEGVLYPYRLIIAGAGLPTTLTMEVESLEINGQIEESVFSIEEK